MWDFFENQIRGIHSCWDGYVISKDLLEKNLTDANALWDKWAERGKSPRAAEYLIEALPTTFWPADSSTCRSGLPCITRDYAKSYREGAEFYKGTVAYCASSTGAALGLACFAISLGLFKSTVLGATLSAVSLGVVGFGGVLTYAKDQCPNELSTYFYFDSNKLQGLQAVTSN